MKWKTARALAMSVAAFAAAIVTTAALFVHATSAVTLSAAQAPPGGKPDKPRFDPAAVARGEQILVQHCGFCHGTNARGGSSGPDLLRSELVLNDEEGRQLAEFLKVGRPDRGMPRVGLADAEASDLATFLHARIAAAADRGNYQILNILTGNPRAGEAFFNGAGGCSRCHSPTGDLQGIGARYDPATLQERLVMPRGRARRSGPQKEGIARDGTRRSGGSVPEARETRPTVTVTLPSGETHTGVLVRLTDFDVTLRDESGGMRSWLRDGDAPKVAVMDPLQAHVDMLSKWTDADMHNVTAYLAGLK